MLGAIRANQLLYPILSLVLSHGFSYVWNYLKYGEYKTAALQVLMTRPYSRIIILHLTVIFGGILVMILQSPGAGLFLLIALKIAFDLTAHVREHAED